MCPQENRLISDEYLEQQKALHDKGNYGIVGHRYADHVLQMASSFGAETILDYGCGQMSLANALPQFPVTGYDPALPDYSERPEPHDMVTCTDVLEHIEPELLDNVLDDIEKLTIKIVFIAVNCIPASKVLSDGRNAHLIQEDLEWWLPKLMKRFTCLNIGTEFLDGANKRIGFIFAGCKKGMIPLAVKNEIH